MKEFSLSETLSAPSGFKYIKNNYHLGMIQNSYSQHNFYYFKPTLMIRMLEFLIFKGNFFIKSDTDRTIEVPNFANKNQPIKLFDYYKPPANRIKLKEPLNNKYLSFSDFEVDFSSLSIALVSPTIGCLAQDQTGICIKCDYGYHFNLALTNCIPCTQTFLLVFGICIPINQNLLTSTNHEIVDENFEIFPITNSSFSFFQDMYYLSYFNFLTPTVDNSLKDGIQGYDRTLTTQIIIKLRIKFLNDISQTYLPAEYLISLVNSDSSYEYQPQMVNSVKLLSGNLAEIILSFSAKGESTNNNQLNYLLALPKNSNISFNPKTDLTVSYISFDEQSLLNDIKLNNSLDLSPLEYRLMDSMLASSYFGPFYIRYLVLPNTQTNLEYLYNASIIKFFFECEGHCSDCISRINCSICEHGFYKDKDSLNCLSCSEECDGCENHPEQCLKCFDFLRIPSNKFI